MRIERGPTRSAESVLRWLDRRERGDAQMISMRHAKDLDHIQALDDVVAELVALGLVHRLDLGSRYETSAKGRQWLQQLGGGIRVLTIPPTDVPAVRR